VRPRSCARAILRKRYDSIAAAGAVEDRDWYGSEFVKLSTSLGIRRFDLRGASPTEWHGRDRLLSGLEAKASTRSTVSCEQFLTRNAEALFGGWKTDRYPDANDRSWAAVLR